MHVVVGGGVVGTAVAWNLARAGREVLLLEARELASGASGGPGMRGVRANGREPAELALMPRAHELWPSLSEEMDIGWQQTGHLLLLEDGVEAAAAQAARETASGIPTQVLDRDGVQELESGVSDLVVGALHCPDDGIVDHTATTRALASAAQAAGAEIRESTAVEGIVERNGRATAVRTDDEEISLEILVVATNAETTQLLEVPLFNVYPQVQITQPLDRPLVRHLIGHQQRPLALKTLPDGAVMITGGRLGVEGEVVQEELDAGLADAIAVFPELEGVTIAHAEASRAESATPDLMPIIDQVAANAWVATGWTGHGFAIAPVVAELLVDWIRTGDRPDLLAPFEQARFG